MLRGTEGAEAPFFSPDGQWIGPYADNALKKIAVSGGATQTICTLAGLAAARPAQQPRKATSRSTGLPETDGGRQYGAGISREATSDAPP